MYRIDNSSNATVLNAPTAPGIRPQGYWTGGNPQAGVPATIVEAEWLNMVQEECCNVVTADGTLPASTLNKGARNQLLLGIRREINDAIGAGVTGRYVLKTGDTMSGTLVIAGGNGVRYQFTSNIHGFAWSGGFVQAYVDGTNVGSLATTAWVNGLGFATQAWVNSQGFATQSWVLGQGYATTSYVSTNYLPLAGGSISGSLSVNSGINVPNGGVTAHAGVFASPDGALSLYQSADGTRYCQYIAGFCLQLITPAVSGFDWTYVMQRYGATWTQWRGSDMIFYNFLAAIAGTGAYINMSDSRAKQDIADETRGLDVIERLQPKSFLRIPTAEEAPEPLREIGFLAEEVRDLLPEAVREIGIPLADGSGTMDEDPTLGIAESMLLPAVVNATTELAGRVKALAGARR